MPQIYGMLQTGREHGMMTMDQSLLELIQRNVIDEETARPLAIDPSKFI